jgi:hypothetical protein
METRENEDQKKIRKQQTPIIDGDARPDINLNPEDPANDPEGMRTDRSKTTKNRNDTNSLEDFRDAKQE